MKTSPNKQLGKNKFYNITKGKNETGYFFFLPTVGKSNKKMLTWSISVFSIIIGFGKYFAQINICESVKNTNTDVFKETMLVLINVLRSGGLKIKDMNAALEYLNKNPYITLILKNANVSHPYIKSIIISYIANQSFVESVN